MKPVRKTIYFLKIFSAFIINRLTRRWKALIVNNCDRKGGRQAFFKNNENNVLTFQNF